MRRINRKIVLITDNAPTHAIPSVQPHEEHGHKVYQLSNIKVVFLPPNVTSHVQPLDQGIIASLKAHYRRQLVHWLLDEANKPANKSKSLKDLTPTFYQMLLWLKQAWEQHVTATTIANCWRKSGLLPSPDHGGDVEHIGSDGDAVEMLRTALDQLQTEGHENGMIPDENDIVSAEQFLSLDAENDEVHELLDDDELVALVMERNSEVVDSDGDDCVECAEEVGPEEAIQHALSLETFVSSRPDTFSGDEVSRICAVSREIRRKAEKMLLEKKKQTDIRSMFNSTT